LIIYHFLIYNEVYPERKMTWTVKFTKKAEKNVLLLPDKIQDLVAFLVEDLKRGGPVAHEWPRYSKLSDTRYHCHLKKGHPTYVACWQVVDKKIKLMEIYYAGTHEKAPY
jgi:mRNA-degrading endonuclease RelE of RelBE toxin-antitoxin system